MKQTIPKFESDEAAEEFVETADLRNYDLNGQAVQFELRRKNKALSLRLPERLLEEIKNHARQADMPVQRFIRLAIERAIHQSRPR